MEGTGFGAGQGETNELIAEQRARRRIRVEGGEAIACDAVGALDAGLESRGCSVVGLAAVGGAYPTSRECSAIIWVWPSLLISTPP